MSENQRWREHFEIAREKLTHSRKGDRGLNNCGLSEDFHEDHEKIS